MRKLASFYGCKWQKHCQTFMGKSAQIYKCFINIKKIYMEFEKIFIGLDLFLLSVPGDGNRVGYLGYFHSIRIN